MPSWDGANVWTDEKLVNVFPVRITDILRCNGKKTRMAIINWYKEGTPLYELSDPHAERDSDVAFQQPFLFVFSDEDAEKAEAFIREFVDKGHADAPETITLFRWETTRLYDFAHGIILGEELKEQEHLKSMLPENLQSHGKMFILPVKRYMYECPVCGHRTLRERGEYDICVECGWEDGYVFGGDEEDDYNLANATCMRTYREDYLRHKAENPNYRWRKR